MTEADLPSRSVLLFQTYPTNQRGVRVWIQTSSLSVTSLNVTVDHEILHQRHRKSIFMCLQPDDSVSIEKFYLYQRQLEETISDVTERTHRGRGELWMFPQRLKIKFKHEEEMWVRFILEGGDFSKNRSFDSQQTKVKV